MRPRIRALYAAIAMALALALIASLLALPWAPLKPLLRHVNPETEAEQVPLPVFMSALLAHALDGLLAGNYSATLEGLKALGAAYVPEKYRFVINRFTQLLNSTSELLGDVEKLLNDSETLIAMGRGEDAKALLNEAALKLASANATYVELRRACAELAASFSLPAGDICGRVDALGRVIMELYLRLLKLLEMAERQATLASPFLTIDVTPKAIWTGGSIFVSGRLYTEGGALAGRTVQVYVDGAKLAQATTMEDGQFGVRASIPYLYRPNVTVQARYTPLGPDAQVYRPSLSNAVEVSLLYIQPRVTMQILGQALPGKSFTLKGQVQANGTLPYSSVTVSWAGSVLNVSLADGNFVAALHTPDSLQDGEYPLSVRAPAWQIYAPAAATIKVKVYRLPLNVTLHLPALAFAGVSWALSGEVLHGSEHVNATIAVAFAGRAYVAHSSGQFILILEAPFTALTGPQGYEVHISPDAPWYSSADLGGSITLINPLTLLVPLGLVSTLSFRLLRGREAGGARPEEAPGEEAQPFVPQGERFSSSGLEWLLDLYWQAVAIVSEVTGVEMKPSMTMREYLAAVGPRLGALRAGFEALTAAAEKALYARAVPSSELESARRAFEELRLAHVGA